MTSLRRSAIAVAVAAFMLLLPGSASGHASLTESDPARGAELESAPAAVTLGFSEPVETSFGSVRVFDAEGEQVQTGELLTEGDGSELGIELRPGLEDGVYTATYRVISADSHPVSGGFVFTVGDAGGVSGRTVSELLASTESGPVTEAAFWLDRWVTYVAIAVAVGLIAFLLLIWAPELRRRETPALPERSAETSRRFRSVLGWTIAVGAVASAAALPLQGATAAGTSFWDALDPEIIDQVLDTRFGGVAALRVLAWLTLLPLLLSATGVMRSRRAASSPALLAAVAGGLFLVLSPALGGHASTQDPAWLIFPSNFLHVAAMALWTGGLFALLTVLPVTTRGMSSEAGRSQVLTAFLLRFSSIAIVAVAVIAVTGTIQAVVEVGSVPALVETAFGRAVLAKVILFAVLILVAAMMRKRVIPALVERRGEGRSPGGPGLAARRNMRIETVLAAVVLAVTAALVGYAPPSSALSEPVSGTVAAGQERLDFTVEPARPGSNEVHIYLFDDVTGAPLEVESLDLAFSLPAKDIAPIEAEVRRAGPGHFVAPSAMLSVKGEWLADADVRLSRFDQVTSEFEVPVR